MTQFCKKDRHLWQVLFLFSMLAVNAHLSAQLSRINCLMPYEIEVSGDANEGVVYKEVEYEDHDDHTFWYRIHVSDNLRFSYEVSSLDGQDNFDIYFYQYDGTNFCRSFIQNNLELISFERNIEYKAGKNTTYYLGIYPLFPGGCGHHIELKAGDHTIDLDSRNAKKPCENNDVVSNPDQVADLGDIGISGKVLDQKTRNLINARLTLVDPFTGHERQIFSDDESGFSASLLEDGDYKLRIQAFGYKDLISALSAYDGESYTYELESSPDRNYVLNNVYFYPNTFALKEESIEELESIYSFLFNHPGLQIEVVGHTNGDKDVKASRFVKEKGEDWNFNGTARELSLKRAEKIKEFMVEKGVDDIRIKTVGKGGEEMIVKDPSNMKEAMQNIRVEILISGQN